MVRLAVRRRDAYVCLDRCGDVTAENFLRSLCAHLGRINAVTTQDIKTSSPGFYFALKAR